MYGLHTRHVVMHTARSCGTAKHDRRQRAAAVLHSQCAVRWCEDVRSACGRRATRTARRMWTAQWWELKMGDGMAGEKSGVGTERWRLRKGGVKYGRSSW